MVTIHHPRSLADASSLLLADPDCRALGGGTAIQILRRQGLLEPSALVDLAGLPELQGISTDDRFLRIGAMATHRQVELSPLVRAAAPLLSETYRQVSNVRVRNTATVGGNLAHGDYRLDPPASLLALAAELELAGPSGPRRLPLRQFFVDLLETALEPAELIVAVRVPLSRSRRSAHFLKFAALGANDWPCVSVAALLEWDQDDRLATARLGIAAMATVPLLVELDDVADLTAVTLADRAIEAALALADPIADLRGSVDYKRRICAVVIRDAIGAAWQREREAARQ